MNAQHTKGPWFWQTSCSWRRLGTHEGDGNVLRPSIDPDGHPNLIFKNGGDEGPDAHLIAAAPELLDALRDCQDALLTYDGHVSNPDNAEGWTDPEAFAAYSKASVAIAKARGETP